MCKKFRTKALVFLIAFLSSFTGFDAYSLSPRTILDDNTSRNSSDNSTLSLLRLLSDNQIPDKTSILEMLFRNFKMPSDKPFYSLCQILSGLSLEERQVSTLLASHIPSFVQWRFGEGEPYPEVVDKTQWILIESAEPFEIKEVSRTIPGSDASFKKSFFIDGRHVVLLPPVYEGGRTIVTLRENPLSLSLKSRDVVFLSKRENLETYIQYTVKVLSRLQFLINRLSHYLNPELKAFCEKLIRSLNEAGIEWNHLSENFRLVQNQRYTLNDSGQLLQIDPLEKKILLPFHLINQYKRRRLLMPSFHLYRILLQDIASQLNIPMHPAFGGEKQRKYQLTPSEWREKLLEADSYPPTNIRLIQLSARVEGQKPGQITEENILEWKSMGFNTLYLMGVWNPSSFSLDYNKHWGKERTASAFSITSYRINPDIGGEEALDHLMSLLKKHGMKLMLDFVPNHMALDNDYLPLHPEYFKHDEPSVHYWINPDLYDSRNPENWPHYPDGSVRFRLWHAKNFNDPVLPQTGDHFLLQELTPDGKQIQVTKFYHGNHDWRDTVQVDFQNPNARAFMRSNYLKAVEMTRGGGIRSDFVHVTLQKRFKEGWGNNEDWTGFLRKWKGVDRLPQLTRNEWEQSVEKFLALFPSLNKQWKEDNEDSVAFLESFIQRYQSNLNASGLPYLSLAHAFHYEGLKEVLQAKLFPEMNAERFREVYDAVSTLRFLEFMESCILDALKKYPETINICEAYENEAYLSSLGLIVYGSYFCNLLVKDRTSLPDSTNRFFNELKQVPKEWPLEKWTLYLQNFDETPAIAMMSLDEIKFKASLLFGLPGLKYVEWGLVEGNRSRLGADWIKTHLDEAAKAVLKPFFKTLLSKTELPVITRGSLQTFDLWEGVRGYSRKSNGDEVYVISNTNDTSSVVPLDRLLTRGEASSVSILVSTHQDAVLKNDTVVLPPRSSVWIHHQKHQGPVTEKFVFQKSA